MSRKRRTRYTDSFKAEAVKTALEFQAKHGRNGVPQIARKLKVHESTLYNWVADAKKISQGLPPKSHAKKKTNGAAATSATDAQAFHELVRERVYAMEQELIDLDERADEIRAQREHLESYLNS